MIRKIIELNIVVDSNVKKCEMKKFHISLMEKSHSYLSMYRMTDIQSVLISKAFSSIWELNHFI